MNSLAKPTLRHFPLRVLLVDDEPVIVDELIEFFEEEGVQAISAPDASASLRILKDAGPGAITVIVTDVKMPGQDGLSFAQSILSIIPERDAVEVVVMTGHGSFGMAIDALRSRVFDFLRKPVKLSELNTVVARAHTAAIARRTRAREDEENSARLREMTLALSARAEALTQRMRDAPDVSNADVLRVISRELRNPLVPVVGLAELLEENAVALKPAQIAEYAGLIRQAGWQLTNLIEAIETAAADDTDERHAPPAEKISDIVAALMLGHGVEARRAGLILEAATPADARVTANRVCLMLALDQIMNNAIRRGRPGQGIRIETELRGSEAVFRITDEAQDSSLPQLSSLRTVSATDDMSPARIADDSRGLSLRLADRIALVLHGRLELHSVPGGTATSIVLPMDPRQAVT